MTPQERFDRAMELFQRACELPVEERTAFLGQACGDDDDLRQEVESLLDHDQAESDAICEAESGGTAKLLVESMDSEAPETLPETIANFHIRRRISSGGMGVVYEAEQDHPKRRVALKVIRTAFSSQEMRRRFQREAEMLGWLQHRGIAHIYQAGSADIGNTNCPYFAMEYIDGEPIDLHANNARLNTNERLQLIARVCDAVQHAHQKGVMHRDLKPANILVAVEQTAAPGGRAVDVIDRIGQPKILDFGVARATDADRQATTLQTHAGQIVGTLGYMSPEQISGDVAELDTRTDVYAIGVILYQLLAGRMPIDLSGMPVTEAARAVREQEPARLGSVDTTLRGDIETVVAKALEKDKDRRYASAAELAADIRRYLNNEPIAARPPSAVYHVRKFARRNRALVGGAAATLAALLLGLGLATSAFLTASNERDIAQRERDAKEEALQVSNAATEFLAEMLTAANPAELGKDVTVRQMLDHAASGLEERFADQPAVEARLRSAIGTTYIGLGEYAKAEVQFNLVVNIYQQLLGEDDLSTLDALNALSIAKYHQGQIQAAVDGFETVVEGFGRALPDDDGRLVHGTSNLAFMYMMLGSFDKAEPMFQRAIDIQRRVAGPDDATLLDLEQNLAQLYARIGRRDDAARLYQKIVDRSARIRGAEHPQTILVMANLAQTYIDYDNKEAVERLREVYGLQRRVLGAEHAQTLITLGNLSIALSRTGQFEEGETLLRDGLEVARRAYGDAHSRTLNLQTELGKVCIESNKLDEAEALLSACIELSAGGTTDDRIMVQAARHGLCFVYIKRGDPVRAIPLAEQLVEETSDTQSAAAADYLKYRLLLDQCRTEARQFEKAEQSLLDLADSATPADLERIGQALIALYEKWQRPDQADKWRSTATRPES